MSNITAGIQIPLLQCKFYCAIEGNFSEDEVQQWSQHIQSCDFDFKNNVVTIIAYQSVNPMLYRIMEKATQRNIEEIVVRPITTTTDCIIVSGIDCIAHSMMFDYGGAEKVVHVMQFSYSRLWHESREFDHLDNATETTLDEQMAQAVGPKAALTKMKKKK